jgi:hypothetical protein
MGLPRRRVGRNGYHSSSCISSSREKVSNWFMLQLMTDSFLDKGQEPVPKGLKMIR